MLSSGFAERKRVAERVYPHSKAAARFTLLRILRCIYEVHEAEQVHFSSHVNHDSEEE
jgi:hypothetical protein